MSGSIALALKTDFDSKTNRLVMVRALVGAIIGGLPGIIYVLSTGSTRLDFGVGLIQVGAMVGGLACGMAAMAGCVVAAIKQRNSGPTSTKAKRLQEYLNPDTLPVIPPPTKPVSNDRSAPIITEKTEIIHRPVEELPTPARKPEPPEPTESEQPAFEDFDHHRN
jgi:hypothetical protein